MSTARGTKPETTGISALPSYAEAVGVTPLVETKANVERKGDSVTPRARILFLLLHGLPTIVSLFLLYLTASNGDSWRVTFASVNVALPEALFASLTGNKSTTDSTANTRRSNSGSGTLSLGIWGWCLSDDDSTEASCSPASLNYDLKGLLAQQTSSPTSSDFSPALLHSLSLHGIALIATMLAAVPLGLYLYKHYFKNDATSRVGWFQVMLALIASLFTLLAWIFDCVLRASVESNLSSFNVSNGLGTTITGVSSLLLFVALVMTAVPAFAQFLSDKRRFFDNWTDEEAGKTQLTGDDETQGSTKRKGRSSSSKRKQKGRRHR